MPANTEPLDYGTTGQTLYAVIRSRTSGQWWNGTAMAAYADANWATYAVAMPEIGTSRVYLFTAPPALPADDYDLMVSVQQGGGPVRGDPPTGTLSEHWSGTTLSPLAPVVAGADPWGTLLPAAYGAGTAGSIVGHQLDQAVGTRLASAAYVPPPGLSAGQTGGLRFLRNRWTLTVGAGGERLRVYAEDGITGDYSGLVTRDANNGINSFVPDATFVP